MHMQGRLRAAFAVSKAMERFQMGKTRKSPCRKIERHAGDLLNSSPSDEPVARAHHRRGGMVTAAVVQRSASHSPFSSGRDDASSA
jgi:hypothetical protein